MVLDGVHPRIDAGELVGLAGPASA